MVKAQFAELKVHSIVAALVLLLGLSTYIYSERSQVLMNTDSSRHVLYIPFMMSALPDPLNIVWSGDWAVAQHLWATLVELDSLGTVVPGLANAWTISDDGRKWIFSLKQDLKWSDGSAMYPHEVADSLNISLGGTSHTDLADAVTEIGYDKDSIVITLKTPVPGLLINLSYIDWAILHSSSIEIGKGRPRVKNASILSGRYLLESQPNQEGVQNRVSLSVNEHFQFDSPPSLHNGALEYFVDCRTLIENRDRMVGFKAFGEAFSDDCHHELSQDFNIQKLAPTWILGAHFTSAGRKKFDLSTRRATLVALHRLISSNKPPYGLQRATGLLPSHLFGALSEEDFITHLESLRSNVEDLDTLWAKGKDLKIVTMLLWSQWTSFNWFVDALRSFGFNVNVTVLDRNDYFTSYENLETDYDLNFIPTGVGDPDPDGAWQMASKKIFPHQIEHEDVKAAFLEPNFERKKTLYQSLAKKLLSDAYFLPLMFDAPVLGLHKSYQLKDTPPFRAGLTIFDIEQKD
jgi:hypothetical protein